MNVKLLMILAIIILFIAVLAYLQMAGFIDITLMFQGGSASGGSPGVADTIHCSSC